MQRKSCELSFRGQNEDCSPGESTLDNSEELPQRGWGEGPSMCDFGEGGVHVTKHIFVLFCFVFCRIVL